MAYDLDDLIETIRQSRQQFLKHLEGLRENQWTWKPYSECKSVAETLAHLIADDRAFMQALETGREPDYESLQEAERNPAALLAILAHTHERLLAYIKDKYAHTPLESEIAFFGMQRKLANALGLIPSEDYYHAGQVAFIRMASDPGWDYYAAIYG